MPVQREIQKPASCNSRNWQILPFVVVLRPLYHFVKIPQIAIIISRLHVHPNIIQTNELPLSSPNDKTGAVEILLIIKGNTSLEWL